MHDRHSFAKLTRLNSLQIFPATRCLPFHSTSCLPFSPTVARPFPINKMTSFRRSDSEVISSEELKRAGSPMLSSEDVQKLESLQYTMSLPRYCRRRQAVIEDDIKDGIGLSNLKMNPVSSDFTSYYRKYSIYVPL